MLSASFFCTSALPNPLDTKTLAIVINTIISAIAPKSEGASILASIMETTKLTSCAKILSPNFHASPVITFCFISPFLSIPNF